MAEALGMIETRGFAAMVEAADACLLYTSDAADDLLCVDLGGRRILKKKNSLLHTIPLNHPTQPQQITPVHQSMC